MQNNKHLDVNTLENWLWEAACKIRGEVDAAKFKDYILPLIFLKRLSDVFEDELTKLENEYGSRDVVEQLLAEDHSLVRFYLPPTSRWDAVAKQSSSVGEFLTDAVRAIAKENPKLEGVIDIVDFNATAGGQRVISDEKLKALIDVLGRHKLGLDEVEPDIIGRAYEYLLRKFAEGSGSSAGEFYTPREVAMLMAHILNPQPGEEIYDPACGSAGLLIKCHLRYQEAQNESKEPLRFYGQELLHSTYAMAKMNVFIHDMEANVALGDTMNSPAFTKKDGSLQKFDVVTANPMWNQNFSVSTYENDTYNRFSFGIPYANKGDWGWIQHMYASLNDKGRMAVVLDTGAVSRGSGSQSSDRERDIRKALVEKDLIEAVLLLPDNLFYNTSAPGIVLVVNKDKKHKGEILLINASKKFKKGSPKNYIPEDLISEIANSYLDWQAVEGESVVITTDQAKENDYNLSPSRYINGATDGETIDLQTAIDDYKQALEESKQAEEKLNEILNQLS